MGFNFKSPPSQVLKEALKSSTDYSSVAMKILDGIFFQQKTASKFCLV